MKDHIKTALIALVCSMTGGAAVFLAMGRNHRAYYPFVGLVGIVAAVIVGVKVYRTYISPGRQLLVEETPAPEVERTS